MFLHFKTFLGKELGSHIKVKFYLYHARRAQRLSSVVAILSLNLNTKRRWVANPIPQSLHPTEKALVPIVQEEVWASGPVWTDAENLAATGVLTQNRLLYSSLQY